MPSFKENGKRLNGKGSKWIQPARRLGIYLRDGLCCAYCGHSIEDGAKLTLDHLIAKCKKPNHKSTNLITACSVCNSRRQAMPWKLFVIRTVPPLKVADVWLNIERLRKRKPKIIEAKIMIADRPYSEALQSIAKRSRPVKLGILNW